MPNQSSYFFAEKDRPITASLQRPCSDHGVTTELAWRSVVSGQVLLYSPQITDLTSRSCNLNNLQSMQEKLRPCVVKVAQS